MPFPVVLHYAPDIVRLSPIELPTLDWYLLVRRKGSLER